MTPLGISKEEGVPTIDSGAGVSVCVGGSRLSPSMSESVFVCLFLVLRERGKKF